VATAARLEADGLDARLFIFSLDVDSPRDLLVRLGFQHPETHCDRKALDRLKWKDDRRTDGDESRSGTLYEDDDGG